MGRTIYKSLPDMALARKRVDEPSLIKEDIVVPELVKRFAEGKTYLIKTFGCQANVRDEEIMSGYLELAGFTKSSSQEEADIVIVNTCAVRENAEEKVYGLIGSYKAYASKNPSFILAVCGCMMQEVGAAETIMKRYPFVNLVFGTHNISKLLNLIDEHLSRHKDLVDVISYSGDIVENLPSIRLDGKKAYVNITYGCDKFCTYCIVPYTRGRERSRSVEEIVNECRELVEQGYQEITLLGQNVNSYGKDLKNGTTFAEILRKVAELGIPRLRFMTSHPWDFSDEMIDVIATYPNIMNCIHLPVQSGSSEVLRLMGRRYTREEYLDLVKRIRDRIPDCVITTDIIVGFPNETAEQFEETLTLAKEVQYDAAFTFIYSPRKGTPAAKIVDNVTSKEKHERFDRLYAVIEESVVAHSNAMIGKVYKVLVEGPSKKNEKLLSGYTEGGKLVHFEAPEYLSGCIVSVRIKESHAYSLIGELAEDPLIAAANQLKSELMKEESLSAYVACKKAYDASEHLQQLRKQIEVVQKEMALAFKNGELAIYDGKKALYEELTKQFEEDPLVCNLKAYQEDAMALLEQVKEALS